jgi:hypothetical protein
MIFPSVYSSVRSVLESGQMRERAKKERINSGETLAKKNPLCSVFAGIVRYLFSASSSS